MTDGQFPTDSFPRQHARTRRYTLGRPRSITVAEDGSRVAFLRSRAGDDPVGQPLGLRRRVRGRSGWSSIRRRIGRGAHLSARSGTAASGCAKPSPASPTTPPIARSRSRRSRWTIGSSVADLVERRRASSWSRRCGTPFDPRPDPTGRRIAYVADGALRVARRRRREDRELASRSTTPTSHGVWRTSSPPRRWTVVRGYWWSPGRRADRRRARRRPAGPHLAHRRLRSIRRPPSRRSATRRRAPTTPSSRSRSFDLDGGRVDVGWDRRRVPVPRERWCGARTAR